MAALLKLPVHTDQPKADMPDDLRVLLNKLRFHASACRASAYLNIFDACAVLDPNADRAEDAQMKTLLRVMGQALEKDPVFLRPGAEGLSFDESWLVAALSARMHGDHDSFAFLMHRRVAQPKRRIFGLLVSGLAEFLSKKV